jgi:hypothetical protein
MGYNSTLTLHFRGMARPWRWTSWIHDTPGIGMAYRGAESCWSAVSASAWLPWRLV